jgi:hypothetical protein
VTQPIDTSRKSSPAENKVSEESQCAVVTENKSPYDQARDYVERFNCWNEAKTFTLLTSDEVNSYEKPFSLKMPFDDWIKLSDDLQIFETDQKSESPSEILRNTLLTNFRYPKYAYYASTSTLIVKFMPSPVHESVTDTITRGFIAAAEGLPERWDFDIAFNQNFNGFSGQYAGSCKVPDLAVEFTNAAGDCPPKFILEIGLSETYEDLLQDARLWLEGNDYVSIVVLVKFVETPKYRSPRLRTKDLVDLDFPKAPELKEHHFNMEGEYGPVSYKGIKWAGVISEAFLEVWKRDPTTRLAVMDGVRTVWSP